MTRKQIPKTTIFDPSDVSISPISNSLDLGFSIKSIITQRI